MEYRTLVLELARLGDALRVAIHEKNGNGESSLRPYEIHPVAWEQVDKECRESLNLLGRANRSSNQSSEALANLKRSGEFLFDLLLPQAVKAKLAHTTCASLTLYLDDSLIHIPWHLLYDGREFFCRRFAKGRVVNTRLAWLAWLAQRRDPSVS